MPTTIILHGCNGRMGRVITDLAAADPAVSIVAGVDAVDTGQSPFPIFKAISECDISADVVVDFSVAAAVPALLDFCIKNKKALVLCTTGLSDAMLETLEMAAREIAILRSANMSLGINLLLKMVKEAAKTLAPAGFDIEIVEKHHNQKLDAPSGTAFALGDAVNESLGGGYAYIHDRSQTHAKRGDKEIGFAAVRGGSITGEHDVIFAGPDEVITLSHSAYSRSVFAKGAVEAAKYLAAQPPGLYTMADVIG